MGSSTGTRNWGIRRFTNIVREGRYRAPAAADLMLGTGVEVDTSDPDYIRQATVLTGLGSTGIDGQLIGILHYEADSQNYNDPAYGAAAGQVPMDMNTAPRGRLVQVIHGPGVKVWFRNTEANTTEPGLNYDAVREEVVMVANLGHDGAGDLAQGDLLAWDATNGYWAETAVPAEAVFRVDSADNDSGICEATFLV